MGVKFNFLAVVDNGRFRISSSGPAQKQLRDRQHQKTPVLAYLYGKLRLIPKVLVNGQFYTMGTSLLA